MTEAVTIVTGDYAHAEKLKAQTELAGVPVSFPRVAPVTRAFSEMVRDQRYSLAEMAIVAFFQAHEAGRPLRLLPVVVGGTFHYGNVFCSPVNTPGNPEQLRGRRIGVRSYSQTTGLWVRAFLQEEYGIRPEDVTWVTTERSHVPEYSDPANVELTERSLQEELADGGIAAAILGWGQGDGMPRLIADPQAAARAWYDRHRLVPINHMIVTSESFAANHPQVVRQAYDLLAEGIDEATGNQPSGDQPPSALRYGIEQVRPCLQLAAEYALDQRLIARVPDIDELIV